MLPYLTSVCGILKGVFKAKRFELMELYFEKCHEKILELL